MQAQDHDPEQHRAAQRIDQQRVQLAVAALCPAPDQPEKDPARQQPQQERAEEQRQRDRDHKRVVHHLMHIEFLLSFFCTRGRVGASVLLMRWCVLMLACTLVCSGADFGEDPPSELALVLVRKAKQAEKAGDIADAYVCYSQASALQPKNRGYRAHVAALQARGAARPRTATPPTEADAPADALAAGLG